MYLRQPPRIKVLEALSAIADGRVRLNDGQAIVVSSDGTRQYKVCIDPSKGIANSTDNGTKYRNYVGYPIISVLMLKGLLKYNEKIANALKGIPWRELNEKYRKYSKVMELIFERLEKQGIERDEVERYIDEVMNELRRLKLRKGTCW